MTYKCPYCPLDPNHRPKIIRFGSYFRTSDSKTVQRFRCLSCSKGFSSASFSPCYLQKKRHKNEQIRRLLCSGVSQRRAALLLFVNRKTIVRKLLFLGAQSSAELCQFNATQKPAKIVEFDDLETFEHTKRKPLSVTLAVESKSRRILGLSVSQMPCRGPLSARSTEYGTRLDLRSLGRKELFQRIESFVAEDATIKSDKNPHYRASVRKYLPGRTHIQFKSRRGVSGAQGELKKLFFDPLFSLNHTCAKLRADINRLFRKTWCTTKKASHLEAHLVLYATFHNRYFLSKLS